MITVSICEDEAYFMDELCKLLDKYCNSREIHASISSFSNGEELLASNRMADIILMDDEIYRIKDAIKIARETLRVVNMNFKFSLFVKAVILILTLFGLVTMWGAVFVDIGVMILAILNATWVYKYPV